MMTERIGDSREPDNSAADKWLADEDLDPSLVDSGESSAEEGDGDGEEDVNREYPEGFGEPDSSIDDVSPESRPTV